MIHTFRASIIFALLTISMAALDASDYDLYMKFHWKGDLQSHSITLKAFPYLDKIRKDNINTVLFVYTKLGNDIVVVKNLSLFFEAEEYPVTQVTIRSLSPNTCYFYSFAFLSETNFGEKGFLGYYATRKPQEFSFHTPEIALKPYSFVFGAASCAATGSTSPVFHNLTNENFNFFIHMGDLHYSDIDKNDPKLFYEAYYKVFNSPTQKQFFQSTPVVYNWDDHDFGVNDAKGTSTSKPAATEAYKKFVPSYPLKNTLPFDDSFVFPDQAPAAYRDPKAYLSYQINSEFGIFRSFIIGRCLFIVMDLRSFQDIVPSDILGEEQKTWIENQLRFAGNNTGVKMVFIVSSVPWIDSDPKALWEDFTIEQEWLGKLVKQHIYGNQKKLMMLGGDAHMLAFDDGRNNKHGGFPVVQAASLDQRPHCKGGPYSHGHSVDRGQYAVIEVIDAANKDQLCVKIDLKKLGKSLIRYDTCHPELYPISEDQHCPSQVIVYLTPYSNIIYVILGFAVFGIIFAGAIYWYKYKNKHKKAAKSTVEKYNLATEEQEEEFTSSPSGSNKAKIQEESYIEQHSELEFQGSI